jgi:predicted Zn-dependent protease
MRRETPVNLRSGDSESGHRPGLLAVIVGFGLWTAACATNPVTGKREFVFMSEPQEITLGQQADAEIRQQMGVYDDPALIGYVEEVGYALAEASHRPELPWTFAIVDSPAINAFALPGGYIYLTRGIMAYLGDEAELAGILGHEIGHVTARHSVQAYSRATGAQLGLLLGQIFVPPMRAAPYGAPNLTDLAGSGLGLMFLKFGRDDEKQADRLGAEYAAAAGWDPRGVSDMLSTLTEIDEISDRRGTPNWISTHPEPADRVADVAPTIAAVTAAAVPGEFTVARREYLERIDGMRFGDNPEQGIVRGSTFLHPALMFGVDFPAGWEIQNSDTVVLAKQPGREYYMLLQQAQNVRGLTLEEIAGESMKGAGYRLQSSSKTTINGLDAVMGFYQGQVSGVGTVFARAAFIRHGRQEVYVVAGVGPNTDFNTIEREIDLAIRSFRRLSQDEADRIVPNVIALHDIQSGDTWQSLAQHEGAEIVNAATLAIMNGYPVNEQPRPGDVIKIAVPGDPKESEAMDRRFEERWRRRREPTERP